MLFRKKSLILWLLTIIWMVVIFGFSQQPSLRASAIDWEDLIIRKTAHFCEYLILSLLFYFSVKSSFRLPGRRLFIAALILVFVYAASDEAHQTFVTGREGRIRDVFIDCLGGLTGLYLVSRKPLKLD
jgi:VanZ family protein